MAITKGEWYVKGDRYPTIESRNTNPKIVVTYPTVAVVNSTFIDHKEVKANASLLAASKDLLEALEEVTADLFYQIEATHGAKAASNYPSIIKAKQAIAKAKGEN
jgi:hypothetical protein